MKAAIIIGFLLICQLSFSQSDTTNSYLNNFQYTVFWSQQGIVNGDTLVRLNCNLNVPDTNSISAIEIKVGNFKGDGSLVNYTFPLNSNFGFPNDYGLSLSGNAVQVDLGNQPPRLYYLSVRIYDSFGNKSDFLFYDSTSNQLTKF